MTSLYERLGGTEGITQIANDFVDLHVRNTLIAPRFARVDTAALKKSLAAFFITGTGGPRTYRGRDMRSVHGGMNIGHDEFMAVLDDALVALDKNGMGKGEKEEVLFILYSMREDIVRL